MEYVKLKFVDHPSPGATSFTATPIIYLSRLSPLLGEPSLLEGFPSPGFFYLRLLAIPPNFEKVIRTSQPNSILQLKAFVCFFEYRIPIRHTPFPRAKVGEHIQIHGPFFEVSTSRIEHFQSREKGHTNLLFLSWYQGRLPGSCKQESLISNLAPFFSAGIWFLKILTQ